MGWQALLACVKGEWVAVQAVILILVIRNVRVFSFHQAL